MNYGIQFYFIMMQEPKRLDITPKELAKLLDRLEKGELTETDRMQLRDVLLAMVWMGQKLEDKDLSIRRMQRLFGMSTDLKGLVAVREILRPHLTAVAKVNQQKLAVSMGAMSILMQSELFIPTRV